MGYVYLLKHARWGWAQFGAYAPRTGHYFELIASDEMYHARDVVVLAEYAMPLPDGVDASEWPQYVAERG